MSRASPHADFHSRWCPTCDWHGMARIARVPAIAGPVDARTGAGAGADAADSVVGVDIRRINLDGDPWRVRLRCQAEGDEWVGRLCFVGPDGTERAEDASRIRGRSALQVMSRALALSERALVGRIRKATR